MKILNVNQLKEMLQKNKNFLKYNGSNKIDTIEEIYNPLNLTYKYKINDKIIKIKKVFNNLKEVKKYIKSLFINLK